MKSTSIVSLALVCAFAGCSTVNVSGQGGNSPPQVRGGSASVQLQNSAAAGVIVTVAILSAVFGPWRNDSDWRDGSVRPLPRPERIPKMLEDRAINEVDCTRPIADWSKNLKCK